VGRRSKRCPGRTRSAGSPKEDAAWPATSPPASQGFVNQPYYWQTRRNLAHQRLPSELSVFPSSGALVALVCDFELVQLLNPMDGLVMYGNVSPLIGKLLFLWGVLLAIVL